MKKSLRASRMERHHKRTRAQGKLSLVSLMDIFTILVFFLLVNSSDVEVLQSHKSVTLPKSTAIQRPDDALVITVSGESILVGGRKIADTAAVMASDDEQVEALHKELSERASRLHFANARAEKAGREVTIMGHKDIPYALLKKIMMTCAETGHYQVALAVNRILPEDKANEPAAAASSNSPAVEG